MKSKIQFPQNDVISNQKETTPICNENLKKDQKQNKKTPLKMIKGKVKVYTNNKPDKADCKYLDEESELLLISERMLLFLKFSFLFLILASLVFFLLRHA